MQVGTGHFMAKDIGNTGNAYTINKYIYSSKLTRDFINSFIYFGFPGNIKTEILRRAGKAGWDKDMSMSLISSSATLAPSLSNLLAIACPIPDAAPVTTATCPLKFVIDWSLIKRQCKN